MQIFEGVLYVLLLCSNAARKVGWYFIYSFLAQLSGFLMQTHIIAFMLKNAAGMHFFNLSYYVIQRRYCNRQKFDLDILRDLDGLALPETEKTFCNYVCPHVANINEKSVNEKVEERALPNVSFILIVVSILLRLLVHIGTY